MNYWWKCPSLGTRQCRETHLKGQSVEERFDCVHLQRAGRYKLLQVTKRFWLIILVLDKMVMVTNIDLV